MAHFKFSILFFMVLGFGCEKARYVKDSDGSGTVTDAEMGLVWASSDNGIDIDWISANRYCEAKGMRLPTAIELQWLYYYADKKEVPSCSTSAVGSYLEIEHPKEINFSCYVYWYSPVNGSCFFMNGTYQQPCKQNDIKNKRALCVRSLGENIKTVLPSLTASNNQSSNQNKISTPVSPPTSISTPVSIPVPPVSTSIPVSTPTSIAIVEPVEEPIQNFWDNPEFITIDPNSSESCPDGFWSLFKETPGKDEFEKNENENNKKKLLDKINKQKYIAILNSIEFKDYDFKKKEFPIEIEGSINCKYVVDGMNSPGISIAFQSARPFDEFGSPGMVGQYEWKVKPLKQKIYVAEEDAKEFKDNNYYSHVYIAFSINGTDTHAYKARESGSDDVYDYGAGHLIKAKILAIKIQGKGGVILDTSPKPTVDKK